MHFSFISIINYSRISYKNGCFRIYFDNLNPSHHKIPTRLEYTSTFTNVSAVYTRDKNTFKTINKPDLLILNTKLYCLSKLFHLSSIGIILSVFVKQNWSSSHCPCVIYTISGLFLVLFYSVFFRNLVQVYHINTL